MKIARENEYRSTIINIKVLIDSDYRENYLSILFYAGFLFIYKIIIPDAAKICKNYLKLFEEIITTKK